MGVQKHMISTHLTRNSLFVNLTSDAKLLLLLSIVECDDDGIVDVYPIMKLLGIGRSALEELVSREFMYPIKLAMYSVFHVIHFHAMNKIPPTKGTESAYRQNFIEQYPELEFKLQNFKKPNKLGYIPQTDSGQQKQLTTVEISADSPTKSIKELMVKNDWDEDTAREFYVKNRGMFR